jgi:hypothetical protein
MNMNNQLKAIVPGKTYPSIVKISEKVNDKSTEIKFLLQSYYVGMYSAIYCDGQLVIQTGDNDNKKFVMKLKKDISKAIKRGVTVEIGTITPCQLAIN